MSISGTTEFAPPKLNLFLHVGPRLASGNHPLRSLVVFCGIELADRLRVEPAADWSLRVSGPFADNAGPDTENLALRAATYWVARDDHARCLHIDLEKNIPVGAGLGGGSADAAACLRGLSHLFGDDSGSGVLAGMARRLGADVPACLFGRPCHVGGTGERLEPASTPPLAAVLVNCGERLATATVFRRFDALNPAPPRPADGERVEGGAAEDFVARLARCRNDLTLAATGLCPAVAEMLCALHDQEGAMLARMSGSGPTCYALFATMEQAGRARRRLVRARPDWWIRTTWLTGSDGRSELPPDI